MTGIRKAIAPIETHILNLGAGVQSTALYLLMAEGRILPYMRRLECAIFADTQEEPEAVTRHLGWLRAQNGPPIVTVTVGKLGDHLLQGRNSTGGRFASIPAFTTDGVSRGITQRQCSKEYKVEPITRYIRRELCGCSPGSGLARHRQVVQYIGISLDEAGRASRIEKNSTKRGWSVRFPLIKMGWTRRECLAYLKDRVPHQVPRSACVFCPYHSDLEWMMQQRDDPQAWARSIEIDTALRTPGFVVNRDMRSQMYLHKSCQPLELVQLNPQPQAERAAQLLMNFDRECLGVCGV